MNWIGRILRDDKRGAMPEDVPHILAQINIDPKHWCYLSQALKMSKSAFAGLLGVSARTLRDWEQGRRSPQGSAVALLRIAEQHSEIFAKLH